MRIGVVAGAVRRHQRDSEGDAVPAGRPSLPGAQLRRPRLRRRRDPRRQRRPGPRRLPELVRGPPPRRLRAVRRRRLPEPVGRQLHLRGRDRLPVRHRHAHQPAGAREPVQPLQADPERHVPQPRSAGLLPARRGLAERHHAGHGAPHGPAARHHRPLARDTRRDRRAPSGLRPGGTRRLPPSQAGGRAAGWGAPRGRRGECARGRPTARASSARGARAPRGAAR